MTSILGGFSIAQQALANQQYGLSITQKNVTNANNPNYTKETVVFLESGAAGMPPSASVDAFRNRFIDYSISQEMQLLGEQNAALDSLQQIDSIFNTDGGLGLDKALTNFFNSFSSLSNSPEDLNLRRQVITSANTLTGEFHRVYRGVQRIQDSADLAIADTADEINAITAQIADLNKQIPNAQASSPSDAYSLRDNRQKLMEQLSSLVDLSYYEEENGSLMVMTKQGGLLVGGDQSYDLEVSTSGGTPAVHLAGVDITAKLESGKLGGLLNVRNGAIADCLESLDDLAATIIGRVNSQHSQGDDLDGIAGGDFFEPFTQTVPGLNAGAAQTIQAAIDDPRLIAAASDGSGPGNNDNAMLLNAIKDENLFSASETISQFYARIIYNAGASEKTAEDGVTTQNNVLDQLKNQRDSFSGVNLDEEAINIIKYQKAYQASAKFISVLNGLCDEILQIAGG